MHLYHEWLDRVREDGIFEDMPDDVTKWTIDEVNAQEFIEAIGITEFITEE
jgi:hypothetical protein